MVIHRAVFLAMVAGLFAATLPADTVIYYNQAQWQSAMSAQGALPLTDVSFASSDWTTSFQSSRSFDSLTSQSITAGISAVAGYNPLGVANNALLGHATNGVWSDTISKYGSTTFNFSDPIYGFGGDFDIAGSNGLEILAGGSPFATPSGVYDGFIGVVSDQPLSSIQITWGQNGGCYQCFGNSYTLGDFQVATDPVQTPEPGFKYAFAGLLVFAAAFSILRRR
jgi:hypothetical protein